MAVFTSGEQYGAKLLRLSHAATSASPKALQARAAVTKRVIVSSARSRSHLANDKWVRYRIVGEFAEVRLRGGFAFLTQKGSYLHPHGWDELPGRRRRSRAKALSTPYGPRARVHHGPLHAKPFWEQGIAASRELGFRAYQQVHNAAIRSAL